MNDDGEEKPRRKRRRYVDDETLLRALNNPAYRLEKDVARALDIARKTLWKRKNELGLQWDKEKGCYVAPPGRMRPTPEGISEPARLRDNVGGYQLMPPTTSQSTTEFANPPQPACPWKRRPPPGP